MAKQKYSNKSASLFDIRLKNMDHDVIVLKGSEHNAASAFVSGKIVFSVSEPITVKRITLKLYGTLRLKWPEVPKPPPNRPVKFEKKVYEYTWDSNEFSKYLNNMYSNSSSGGSANVSGDKSSTTNIPKLGNPLSMSKAHSLKGSTTSLKNLGMSLRSMSSTSLSHLSNGASHVVPNSSAPGSAGKGTHILVQGNYEIPFQAILPGDMPESVEGLPGANVVYKFEAQIERGKFHNTMITKKRTRVVRTMTTDAAELSETMAVDNTWPKKVEYSLSIPSKAIAIGAGTPVTMMLVPLLKGLQLGEIKMTLVEMYSFVSYIPPPHTSERVVCEKVISAPTANDSNFQMDRWEITTFLKVPPNLSKCTQDCDIQTHLKVRHKLKFVIGLKNPDGHTSELRASLPVQLFISPFVGIRARTEDDEGDELNEGPHEEESIFDSNPNAVSQTSLNQLDAESTVDTGALRSNPHSASSFTGLVAPPIYEQHVYDRLWTDVSPMDSPLSSGTQTPRSLYNRPGTGDMSQFSMSAIDTAKLSENLRQLSIQRQLQEGSEGSRATTPGRATFNLDGDQAEGGDYFSRGRPILNHSGSSGQVSQGSQYGNIGGLLSPGGFSPEHLSRTNSESNINQSTLSQVPSYNEAMKSNVEDTLSPKYMPPLPGSSIDLAEVNRRFEENTSRNQGTSSPNYMSSSRNRSFLSRASPHHSRGASRNSSNDSSPSTSRNVSFSNLAALSGDSVGRAPSRRSSRATFSMAP
ncbi:hypothetical protein JCM33374_g512 [Metschnikowia sp. JCM 33374]|nr:hypothetical protein JCM33374_g512 [Metschnikowia sp. JCM 33374]